MLCWKKAGKNKIAQSCCAGFEKSQSRGAHFRFRIDSPWYRICSMIVTNYVLRCRLLCPQAFPPSIEDATLFFNLSKKRNPLDVFNAVKAKMVLLDKQS